MRPLLYCMNLLLAVAFLSGLGGLGGCSVGNLEPAPDHAGDSADADADAALIQARPYEYKVPAGYDPQRPTPLILLLHGYKTSGAVQKVYFGLDALADSAGVLLAYPDGTADAKGFLFWNATDACCDSDHLGIDDVAYLRAVLRDLHRRYNIDRQRVFVIGHSNGGFMGYRLACELSDELAAVVSLAGATWADPGRCHPSSPVSILQIHGDADETVHYGGGAPSPPLLAPYPAARETAAQWMRYDGCPGPLADTGTRLNLVTNLPDGHTRVERAAGCAGATVELWTIAGGVHIPPLLPTFAATLYAFLMAHPKQ
ncbi:MAG TPA: PHB depolymerase family esterase [Pseudomonadota bacterium]|nr:PHB depolymerase family esterase [Pseudomonadota bacterium]